MSPLILRRRGGRQAILAAGLVYALADAMAVRASRWAAHDADPFVAAAAFPVMHACWGAGFLTSIVEDVVKSCQMR